MEEADAVFAPAPADGVFPEHFYATTNLETLVRIDGSLDDGRAIPRWTAGSSLPAGSARSACRSRRCASGEPIAAGRQRGARRARSSARAGDAVFGFMGSKVSSEKPKALVIRADRRRGSGRRAQSGQKVLVVGGPAVVHTGSARPRHRPDPQRLRRLLFAGNALATHDIEIALFGTSLGVSLDRGAAARRRARAPPAGDQPHPRGSAASEPAVEHGRAQGRHHARLRRGRRRPSSWPARSATTAPCRRSSPTCSRPSARCARAVRGRRRSR